MSNGGSTQASSQGTYGSSVSSRMSSGRGFTASLAALLVGFIPPSQFSEGNSGVYILIVAGGALGLGLLVPYLFYRSRKPSWKQPDEPQPTEEVSQA